MPLACTSSGPVTTSNVLLTSGFLAGQQVEVPNVTWALLSMDYVAPWGRSHQNIGTVNDLLCPQVWAPGYLTYGFLFSSWIASWTTVLWSWTPETIGCRDSSLWFCDISLVLLYLPWLIETLSRRNTGKLWCVITEGGGHHLGCRWSIDWQRNVRNTHDCSLNIDYLSNISRHQFPSLLVLCQIGLQSKSCPWFHQEVFSSWLSYTHHLEK